MVDKGLRLSRALGYTEDVGEEFFDQTEMRSGVEGAIKGQNGARAFEAVPCEVELVHGMY